MRITRLNGIAIPSDTLETTERIEAMFNAGSALVVGEPVIINHANATVANRAKTVVSSTTAGAALVVGIYEGIGGSGAQNESLAAASKAVSADGTVTLTGREAVSGDVVMVTIYGEARARVNLPGTSPGPVNDISVANPLTASKTAGRLEKFSALAGTDAAGLIAPMVALEASSNATASAITTRCVRAFVRLL